MNYKRMWESLKERVTVPESTGNMMQQAMSKVLLDNMLRIEEREKKYKSLKEIEILEVSADAIAVSQLYNDVALHQSDLPLY